MVHVLNGSFIFGLSDSFVASARQLAKALEVPLVNDLGYTKRYVRCLQVTLASVTILVLLHSCVLCSESFN